MENTDKAIATVTGLQVGTYHFRLTVKDQQGLSSASVLSITVKEGKPGCCFLGHSGQLGTSFSCWWNVKESRMERCNIFDVIFQMCLRKLLFCIKVVLWVTGRINFLWCKLFQCSVYAKLVVINVLQNNIFDNCMSTSLGRYIFMLSLKLSFGQKSSFTVDFKVISKTKCLSF